MRVSSLLVMLSIFSGAGWSAEAEHPRPRPAIIPGTFILLVVNPG